LFLAAAPKLAAAGMAFRLLPLGTGPMLELWQGILVVLAALSLVIGNLAALVQSNLKRMLAYSTISHVGFILLGLLHGGDLGMSAVLFYVIVYAISTTAAFGIMLALSRAGVELEEIADFRGLNQRHPFYAFLMLLTMGTLAGFPPLIGFFAKLQVLQAAFAAGFIWLVIVAAVCAVIGAYYYLNLIKVMYFDAPQTELEVKTDAPLDVKVVVALNALAFIALGLYWGPLAKFCASVWGITQY
jgi:NADH-quinone oxidoreductase subunit N